MPAFDLEHRADTSGLGDRSWVIGVPSPQAIVAVKSLIGALGFASIKVPTTVVAGTQRPYWP